MEILGAPLRHVIIALLISLALGMAILLPALENFPRTLIGTEDINLFVWIFWHYQTHLDSGKDPLLADEIFYPYGISLARSSTSPLLALGSYLMPDSLGFSGKITLLQILSYTLGGALAFCLAYRFTKSFWPSVVGMVLFDFSVFHFEAALHHLNYAMAFPILPLLFIFYLDILDGKKRSLLFLSATLIVLSLIELTLVIMAGFVLFIDIMMRYRSMASPGPLRPKEVLILCASVVFSLVLYEALAFLGAPGPLTMVVPSLIFISACVCVIGAKRFIDAERGSGWLRAVFLAAIPVYLYLAFLAIQPGYTPPPDQISFNLVFYRVGPEYLFLPSDLQLVSRIAGGLEAASGTGVYFGLAFILLAASYAIPGAGEEEGRYRSLCLLFVLFSFPLIELSGALIPSPFVAQPLFPLLSVLRVSSRFILFALLFSAIAVPLALQRVMKGLKMGMLAIALIALILLAERWPDSQPFIFDPSIPPFYGSASGSIFLFPNMDYHAGLREMYYQTAHGQPISGGIVSRQPRGKDPERPVFGLYTDPGDYTEDEIAAIASGYDFTVVQKLECDSRCFYARQDLEAQKGLGLITDFLEARFGPPVYEDERMIVFSSKQ